MEDLFVFLIDENSFCSWKHQFEIFNEPVHSILVKNGLREGLGSMGTQKLPEGVLLKVPSGVLSSHPLVEEVDPAEAGLMVQSPSCFRVQLVP